MRDPEHYREEPAGRAAEEDDFSRAVWSAGDGGPDALQDKPTIALEVVTGRVKWFDGVRGFGFLVSPAHDDDILLHYNLLTPHGRKS